MGQEIVYCFKCQTRVLGGDLKNGNALRTGDRVACSACVPALLEALTPQERKNLLSKVQGSEPRTGSGPRHTAISTTRIPVPRPASPAPASSPMPLLAGGVGALLVLVIGIVVSTPGSKAPDPLPASRPIAPAPGPEPESPRVQAAREAFAKARRMPSGNLDAQIAAHLDALKAAEGTPYHRDVEETLKALQDRRRREITAELAELAAKAGSLADQGKFRAAIEAWRSARPRRAQAEWTEGVEKGIAAIEQRVTAAFEALKQKAVEAARKAAPAEVAKIREEIVRWELPERLADFDAQLRGVAPVQEDIPWRPLFDGRSNTFLGQYSRRDWVVEDGALVKKGADAAQSAQDYSDGQFRFRFEVSGATGQIFFAVRQSAAGVCQLQLRNHEVKENVVHEVVFTCNGPEVRATLNGRPEELRATGQPLKGRLQWNAQAARCRILSVDYRPLP